MEYLIMLVPATLAVYFFVRMLSSLRPAFNFLCFVTDFRTIYVDFV